MSSVIPKNFQDIYVNTITPLISTSANISATNITTVNLIVTSATIPNITLTGSLNANFNSNTIGSLFTTGGNVGINSTAPSAHAELTINGGNSVSTTSQANIAFGFAPNPGYYHFINSRHDANVGNVRNSIDFYLNNSNTQTGSSAPNFGNVNSMSITATGVGIFNSNPSSALDVITTNTFGNIYLGTNLQNRKIVLYSTINNDHQYHGFGINAAMLRYQADAVTSDHVFFAGTGTTTSNELFRIKGTGNIIVAGTTNSVAISTGNLYATTSTIPNIIHTNMTTSSILVTGGLLSTFNSNTLGNIFTTGGNVGVGTVTPSSALDIITTNTFGNIYLSNSAQNRKIVLYNNVNNDHQYFGFGINDSTLRYQIGQTGDSHVFYVGTGIASSNEIFRISGFGNITVPGTTNSVAISTGNLYATTSTIPNIILTNITSTNIVATNIISTTISAANIIGSTNISSAALFSLNQTTTNAVHTNVSTVTLLATNVSSAALFSLNQTTTNIVATNSSITNLRINSNIYSGTTSFTTTGAGNLNGLIFYPKAVFDSGNTGLPSITANSVGNAIALRVRGNDDAVMDFGVNSIFGSWIQTTNYVSGYNINYPLLLNPNGGNVGINTTTVNFTLDIIGSTRAIGTNYVGNPNNTADNLGIFVDGNNNGLGYRLGIIKKNGAPPFFATNNISSYVFTVANNTDTSQITTNSYTTIMTLTTLGNLTITGTSNSVAISTGNLYATISTIGNVITNSIGLGINTAPTSSQLDARNNGSANINLQNTGTGSSQLTIFSHGDSRNYFQTSGDLYFTAIGSTTQRTLGLTTNGNVNIGSSNVYSPISKLTITGGLNGSDVNNTQANLAFSYTESGYNHFISSRHINLVNSNLNSIDFWLNNSVSQTASTSPNFGNVNSMSITAIGVSAGNLYATNLTTANLFTTTTGSVLSDSLNLRFSSSILTISNSKGAYIFGADPTDANRQVYLVSSVTGTSNILSFRNTSTNILYDIINEGTSRNRFIIQQSHPTSGINPYFIIDPTNPSISLMSSVGINTTSPTFTLDVTGTARITNGLLSTFNSNTLGNIFTTGGNVGIGTTAPAFTLDVVGTSRISTSLTTGSVFSTNITSTNIVGTNNTLTNLILTSGSFGSLSTANISVSGNITVGGNLIVQGSLISVNVTSVNVINSNITTSSLNASNITTSNIFINNTATIGTLVNNAGAITIQGEVNGGVGKGIYWWSQGSPDWASYFSTSGLTNNIAGGVACSGASFSSWAIRNRIVTSDGVGFIWENNSNNLLASIRGSDGLAYFAGNVGIGNTGPSYKLDVSGTARITTSLTTASIYSTNQTTTNIVGTNITSTSIIITGGLLSTFNSNTLGNIFTTDGNVGIGTTAPAFTLDVVGTSRISTSLTTGSVFSTNITSTNIVGTNNTLTNLILTSGSFGSLSTANISVSGNITVGGNLIVQGSLISVNVTSVNVINSNITTSSLNASNITVTNLVAIGVSAGNLYATNLTTANLFTTTTGSVLSDSLNLRFSSSILTISNSKGAYIFGADPTDLNRQVYLVSSVTGTSNILSFRNTSTNILYDIINEGTSRNRFIIQQSHPTSGINPYFIIDPTNPSISLMSSVGINTTSPAFTLDVTGTARITNGLLSTFNSNTLGNIFTTGGNVGIGTTAPAFTLDVVGTSRISTSLTTGSVFSTNITSTNIVGTNNTLTNLILTSGSFGSLSTANISVSGNITVGGNLIVQGSLISVNVTSVNVINSNITTSSLNASNITVTNLVATIISSGTLQFTNNGSSIIWGNSNSRIFDDNNLHILTDDLMFFHIANTTSTAMLINAAGNVGINTTQPGFNLDVNGIIRTSTLTSTNITGTNIVGTNISTGTIQATSSTISNIVHTNICTGTLIANNVSLRDIQTTSRLDIQVGNKGGTILGGWTTLDPNGGTSGSSGLYVYDAFEVAGPITSTSLTTGSVFSTNITSTNIVGTNNTLTNLILTSGSFGSLSTANISVSGNITVGGNLIVQGSLISVNVTSVNVINSNITTSSLNASNITTSNIFINNTATIGTLVNNAGAITIQGEVNGGVGKGIYWWSQGSPDWASYFSTSGLTNNIAGGVACSGASFSSWAIRNRILTSDGVGFIWENNSNNLLASIRGSDGLAYFAGNVGIGNTGPSYKLDVSGTARITTSLTTASIYSTNQTTTNIVGTNITSTSIIITGGLLSTFNSNTLGNIFTTDGNVGIGTTAPAFTLDVVGTSRISTSLTTGSVFSTNITSTNIVGTNNTLTNLILTSGSFGSLSTANISVSGNITVGGNLIVQGSLISVNVTSVNVINSNITTSSLNASNITTSNIFINNTATIGTLVNNAGAITIQGEVNGGVGKGIYWWSQGNTDWASYFSTSGLTNNIAGGVACSGASFSNWAIRNRILNDIVVGFIWENTSNNLLASIRGSDGLAYFAGNVGIGNTGPSYKLDVSGTARITTSLTTASIYSTNQTTTNIVGTNITSTSIIITGGLLSTFNSNTLGNIFTTGGNVGIDTTAPTGPLQIGNTALFSSNGNLTCTGDVIAYGSISDQRLKTNIQTITSETAINTVKQLNPVTFNWRDNVFNIDRQNKFDSGFIAQEVNEILEHATGEYTHIESGIVYKNLKHERIIPYLLRTVQCLLERVELLENNF